MANFDGTARSNYFKVKDAEAFKAWVAATPSLDCWDKDGMFAVASADPDTGCWPSSYYDEDDNEVEIDMVSGVSEHLADGEVCVLMEAGAEKLRYISGCAVAFDNTDKPPVHVNLNDIYALAKRAFGVTPTVANY